MSYREILQIQKNQIPNERKWWPDFLYHFTDVHNASSILRDGWIRSREMALQQNIMQNDNASRAVIDATNAISKSYGRLYFRPMTPTQYHNEGYKPQAVRNVGVNANCPVPIFFCLDLEKTLNYPGTKFAEKGIAGNRQNIQEGENAFSKLHFSKIYHHGYYSQEESDIKEYRHSEVIRQDGFPIAPLISCILCRTEAERETLLYLLKQYSLRLYNAYKDRIIYNPSLICFYKNGIFLKRVSVRNNNIFMEFNDPEQRTYSGGADAVNFNLKAEVVYCKEDGSVCGTGIGNIGLNYNAVRSCQMKLGLETGYNSIRLKIIFDDVAVMYENEIFLDSELL